jgi:hypothetical protein
VIKFKLQNVIYLGLKPNLLNVLRKEKRKTVLRTIRIDRELDDALFKDAQENDINENALISSLLVKYIEWDRYAKKIGRVTLPKEALKSIIESTEIDKLKAVVKEYSATVPKDIVMFRYKKFEIESCLSHLSFLGKYSGLFKYELQIEHERYYTITIHHDFGEKFSYWLEQTIVVGLFDKIPGIATKVSSGKSSLIFSFILP